MKITIVTPSYNQGEYIEETINSVLTQGIADLEYIIIDGGSTDRSIEIIKKYEQYISYWQSKPDEGQSQAIVQGFERSTGDLLAWLNSDDMYQPGTLRKVQRYFSHNPDLQLLYADYALLYGDRLVPKPKISFDFDMCLTAFLMIPQTSAFWTRDLYEAVGGLNPHYHYAFDFDFFLRIGHHLRHQPNAIRHVQDIWSCFRVHNASKSVSQQFRFRPECEEIRAKFGFPRHGPIKKIRQYYHLIRCLYRFHVERGFIPTRKEPGKA